MEPGTEFVLLLTRMQPRLRGLLKCLLFDPAHVDDVLQDVNVQLLQQSGQFAAGTDFWAWASQVARYQVLTCAKKLGRDRLVFDDSVLALIAHDAEVEASQQDERRAALQQCLQQLPAPQRQLLELRYTLNGSIDQIARQLSRPAGSVRQTLYRIRELLWSCVESRLAGEAAS